MASPARYSGSKKHHHNHRENRGTPPVGHFSKHIIKISNRCTVFQLSSASCANADPCSPTVDYSQRLDVVENTDCCSTSTGIMDCKRGFAKEFAIA